MMKNQRKRKRKRWRWRRKRRRKKKRRRRNWRFGLMFLSLKSIPNSEGFFHRESRKMRWKTKG